MENDGFSGAMARGWWWIAAAAALVAIGCGDDEESGGSADEGKSVEKSAADAPEISLDDHRVHLKLRRLAHLADVEHHGLYIDMGTPARPKYTIGRWRTGWGEDGSVDDTTFTEVGPRGSLYFPIADPGPLTIRVRLRPSVATKLSPYVNGEGIELIRLEKGKFGHYDITVPKDKVRAGENKLLLVFANDDGEIAEGEIAAKVSSVRVIPGHDPSDEGFEPPAYGTLRDEVEIGGSSRPAVTVPVPTTLRYHVKLPQKAKLSFGIARTGKGETSARVAVRPEGEKATEVFSGKVGPKWKDEVVDLSRFGGRFVRLDLRVDGEGKSKAAWAEPRLYTPASDDATGSKSAKHVIVLLIDTLRASKLKVYNPDSRVRTPNLTEVAKSGTVFERPQAPENWTKPSCASVLTALYPSTHETKRDKSRLPSSAQLIGEHLGEQGFQTASFIANGYVSGKFGFDQGWNHYTNYIREEKNTEAETVFQEAGDWIEKNKDDRFFAYIQTIDPHVPYDPPDKYLKMYDDKKYDGQVEPRMTAQLLGKAKKSPPEVTFDERDKERLEALHDGEITYHDHYMGKFIERLKSLGVWKDTLFVITSDHGEEFNEHGSWGHGHSSYQELLHVPLIFHQPGVIPEGRRVPETVSTLDIPPTVLELLDVDQMPDSEGRSLVGYMRGDPPPGPSVAFSEFLENHRVIRAGRYKLILKGLNAEFYDLREDPWEQDPLDRNEHPVAFRYSRVMLGQFLGASDRGRWLDAEQDEGVDLEAKKTKIDEETRGQLRALGYAN